MTKTAMTGREELLAEELLLVRDSGELPEVALHASLHHLEESAEGPRLVLTVAERRSLEMMAAARYETIIRRDLNPANRGLRLFRGLSRALANWRRYVCFRARRSLDGTPDFAAFRREAGRALVHYLEQECAEEEAGMRAAAANLRASDILALAEALNVLEALPRGWKRLCGGT